MATTRAWRPAGGDVTGIGHPVRMRLATWNVNSLRARLPRLLDWLDRVQPDVVCLQETKMAKAAFPREELHSRGI